METVKITPKKSTHYEFNVTLNWIENQTGSLSTVDTISIIKVATPTEFGGEGKEWSPETLFLASVNSCFMSTFLVFAKKVGLSFSGISCETTGAVEMVDGHFEFTTVDVFPKIRVNSIEMADKVQLALEKTEKYCLVSNSLKTKVSYHGEWELVNQPA